MINFLRNLLLLGTCSACLLLCIRTAEGNQRQNCPALRIPSSGFGSGSGCIQGPAPLGSQCSFSCNQGRRLIGFKILTCFQDGTWSSSVPNCEEPSCRPLVPPPGGQMSGSCSRAKPGESCRFTCTAGGRLVGSNLLACGADLTWSTSPPACLTSGTSSASCSPIRAPLNGAANGNCQVASSNQRCDFSCNNGYILSGRQSIQCLADGTWNGAPPFCSAQGK